ncbi:mucin-2-like [Neocloeon triangulifer]|uniref:mucin-2-like n=1 Tax=Neocloeon triangulifer TaxID=2078957 RepID=UPI00286F5028|nr:mucin-2-like [Neocloeon triangulifer]
MKAIHFSLLVATLVSSTVSQILSPNRGCQLVTDCPRLNGDHAVHLPNPLSCESFCKCDWGKAIYFQCPKGLHFNRFLEVCDWPDNAKCQTVTRPTSTTISTTPSTNPSTTLSTTLSTTTSTTTPTTSTKCRGVECPQINEGPAIHKPNPGDCSSFCKCDWGKPIWFACPPGLHFNPALEVCDWPSSAGCKEENTSTTTVFETTPERTTPSPTTPEVTTPPTTILEVTTLSPTTTTPEVTTPSSATSPTTSTKCRGVECPQINEGLAIHKPNPGDCSSFCKCDWGKPIWFACPPGLHFNPVLEVCDWPSSAGCKEEENTSTTTVFETTPERTTPSPTTTTPEVTTQEVTTSEVSTSEVTTSEVTTPEGTTPEVTTPPSATSPTTTLEVTTLLPTKPTLEVTTPEVTTQEVTTPEVTTQEVTTPEVTTLSPTITEITTLSQAIPEVY